MYATSDLFFSVQRKRMLAVIRIILMAGFLLRCISAESAVFPLTTEDNLAATIQRRFPDAKVEGVKNSAVTGLYEVIVDGQIVYADATGDHVLMGPLVETLTRRNLTDESLSRISAIDFDLLPLALAIRTVKGDGRRKLAVFADPHCPYCVELEKSLEEITDVTVYTFLYPLEAIHPGATARAKALWCAEDRSSAWQEWMINQKTGEPAQCGGDPVAELQALGESFRINTTPTLFLSDGRRILGAVPAQGLEKLLESTAADTVSR